ncbi:20703_t:CDS:2 [Dentiscutata erythropus]|uniref:20703_t:CDS:1 n=1 Tax=Dentiscutata erythropus TaxID=1348616 RepID=A0A9N9A2B3_9GLOM|nr:20703_t:CDS:2 [Dentiscutata erythropus]
MPESQLYIHDLKDFSRHDRDRVARRSTAVKSAPKIGNPTPLGLSAFAMSTFVASFYSLGIFGVSVPNVLIGVAFFTGGVVQFASGMWEFKVGNTFGGTGFSAFGGFWASLGAIYMPAFGIQQAYGFIPVPTNAVLDSIGLCKTNCNYTESSVTFIFTLACLRTNAGVLGAFVSLTVAFLADTIYHLTPTNTIFLKVGGVFELITSAIVFYCLAAVLLTPDLSPVSLPLYDLSKKD